MPSSVKDIIGLTIALGIILLALLAAGVPL